ncbi:MAG: Uncharacterized protein XE04_0545 [Marinimicrobia bacterium 46_43]|nr:MAG: Uncharacterized protein XE04_0545 [Marinimicrobia bacterium 46_43]HBY19162.1 hypothetical protein [Candidatus Neomarinimicrobiota bacterium]
MIRTILLLSFVLFFQGCDSRKDDLQSPVNLNHALNLTDSLTVDGESLSFIYIYADAPSYAPVIAPGEGITCVDDVGRFLEVLETEIIRHNRNDLLPIAAGMTLFLLYMGRDDGLWFNFMLKDGSINTKYRTSTAEFQWWAIRGLRGLTAAYNIFRDRPKYADLHERVKKQIQTMDPHLKDILSLYPETEDTPLGARPLWLIKKAPDMNAELLTVLVRLTETGDFNYHEAVKKIAEGLMGYQYLNPESELHGMYFCWESTWHNWGNTQAAALMAAYRLTENPACLESVRLWADHFVPFVLTNNFPWEITVHPDSTYTLTPYPQIAYGINSMYQGIKALADVTGDPKDIKRSEEIFAWFTGKNTAAIPMYDPGTGRCYDGIDDAGSVNYNSGAESTIECLLAMQRADSQ